MEENTQITVNIVFNDCSDCNITVDKLSNNGYIDVLIEKHKNKSQDSSDSDTDRKSVRACVRSR